MDAALIALDLVLLLGLALRLTRLAVADTITEWYVHEPLFRWSEWWPDDEEGPHYWKGRLVSSLLCPFCIGFHVCWTTVLSLYLVGGPGDAADWWRWVAAAFALNYVQGHVNARLDA